VLLLESVELVPVQVAVLAPTTQVAFRHSPCMLAVNHQQRPIVIDTVILIVTTQLVVDSYLGVTVGGGLRGSLADSLRRLPP
jgi:hypothetical protein